MKYSSGAVHLSQTKSPSEEQSMSMAAVQSFSRTPIPLHRHRPAPKTLAFAHPPFSVDLSPSALPLLCTATLAAAAAAFSLSDPERRRQKQALQIHGTDKEVVRDYFNSTGFDRWKKIYGDATTDGISKIQLDIRIGHSRALQTAILMLRSGGPLSGVSVCDAGCGIGSLAIPLALDGAFVSAVDISPAMVAEARRRAAEAIGGAAMPRFEVGDLEALGGRFHTVVCIDVLIHYSKERAEAMIARLASIAEERIVLSFAPKTACYSLLKRVGELFPGSAKATRAYLHDEADVERAIQRAGWTVRSREFVGTRFYFAKIVEAVPAS